MGNPDRYIKVDHQPFFILGAQVHNSSAYSKERMAPLWEALLKLHVNTAEIPVYWEQVEPKQGVFDFAMVDSLLEGARVHGLKLVLLWFASWKNGTMKYAPSWIKLQPDRYRRVITSDGAPLTVLSAHCPANLEADRNAFCALMAYLKQADDVCRTVIAVQIENEPGTHGSDRDYSEEATALFAAPIPVDLAARLPESSSKNGTTWGEVFGLRAAEAFSSWHVARYIDAIAEAGKRVHDLPMYVNVWLAEQGFRSAGYDYPSGGAVSDMIDIWKAAAPHIDLLAPDIYIPGARAYRQVCANYCRSDNPLFIPECRANAITSLLMFYAIADYDAIGVAPFAIEDILDGSGGLNEGGAALADSYAAVRAVLPLLLSYQGTGKVHAIVQEEWAETQVIELDGYVALARFGVSWMGRPVVPHTPAITSVPTTRSLASLPPAPVRTSDAATRGRGLLIQTGPKEFYATGVGFTVLIRPVAGSQRFLGKNLITGQFDPWLLVEAGHFERDTWIVDEHRSGDESDYGLIAAVPGQAVHAVFE